MDGFFDYIYSLRNYYIYGTLVISIPSFLLYLSEVLVIIKNKKLHNSFNKLFVIRAITDFFKLWSQLFGNRLPKIIGGFLLPFYQLLPNWILALYFFFLFFCFYADNLATAAIQFNRFTAIAFPMHYEKIWRYLLPLSILIIYGISVYLSFCFFSMGTQLVIIQNDPLSGNRTSFTIIEVGTHNLDSNTLVASFSIIFLIGCTALSLLTIFLYKWRNRGNYSSNKNNQNSQIINNSNVLDPIEKKLLIYAMTTFAAQAIITVYFISYGFPFIPMNFLLTFGPMVVEIGTIILPSWLMLWASFDFRKQWAKDVLPKRWNLWKNDERKTTNNINISRKLPSQLNGNGLRMPMPIQSSQNNNVSPLNCIARIK